MSTQGRRRAFGQHFLHDQNVIGAIIELVAQKTRDTEPRCWVEIGPGEGALTLPAAEVLGSTSVERWTIVEKDRALAETWQRKLARPRTAQNPEIKVLSEDFLNLPETDWAAPGTLVFSNLPYSTGTAIFQRLVEARVDTMILMFQSEVARRLRAPASTPDRGSLSIWCQNLYAIQAVLTVGPRSFTPPPRVESEVILLERRPEAQLPETQKTPESRALWQSLIKLGFSQRRKMLRGVLGADPIFKQALLDAQVSGELRAEALELSQWGDIFRHLARLKLGGLMIALAALGSGRALANVSDTYGLGATHTALAGALVSTGSKGFSSIINPAAISSDHRLEISFGLQTFQPSFQSANGITTMNTVTGDSVQTGNTANDYAASTGQVLGVNYQIAPEWWNLSLGFTSYLPLSPIATVDTGETFLPEYFLYRARTQRPQLAFGVGVRPNDRLRFGVSIEGIYSLTSGATLFLQTAAQKPSSLRFQAALGIKAVPIFGAIYEFKSGALADSSMGLVVRLPSKSDGTFNLNSSARVFGDSGAAFDFQLTALSALYQDPWSVEWGWTIPQKNWGQTYLEIDYQAWSGYAAPVIQVTNTQTSQCTNGAYCPLTISPGLNGTGVFHDLVIPRVGQEIYFGSEPHRRKILRLGYFYRGSILYGWPESGNQNLLDLSKHWASLGWAWEYPDFLGLAVPWELNLSAVYQVLVGGHVTKSGVNDIGYPGYDVGGKIWGLGLSMNWAL